MSPVHQNHVKSAYKVYSSSKGVIDTVNKVVGAPAAQWVKPWPTDLAVPVSISA